MALSTTAKAAALCLCPPAVLAGTVATVPAAKRAVHHLTAPHYAHAHARPIAAHKAAGAGARVARADCNPVAPPGMLAVPLITYAAPIPDEPGIAVPAGGGVPGSGGGEVVGTIGAGPVAVAPAVVPPAPPVVTPAPTPVITGAVPEPATWLMIIGGVGAMGAVLRRRRTAARMRAGRIGAKAIAGAGWWSGGSIAEAGDVAATVAVKSTVAAKSTAAGLAAKALMCVCPAAVATGGVMAVPQLRHAVHMSTAAPVATAVPVVAQPCADTATAIPVSAAPLNGFPPSVSTVRAVPRITS